MESVIRDKVSIRRFDELLLKAASIVRSIGCSLEPPVKQVSTNLKADKVVATER